MAKKQTDYTKKTDEDLKKDFLEHKKELRKIRFDSSGAKVSNVHEASHKRKEVARILTEMRKREVQA